MSRSREKSGTIEQFSIIGVYGHCVENCTVDYRQKCREYFKIFILQNYAILKRINPI